MKNLIAAFLLSLAVAAQPAASEAQSPAPKDDVTATDARLITDAGFAEEDVGYLVVDLGDKRVVAAHNPDRLFLPASVAKIPTIAAALAILGGDHRFVTTLLAEGELRDGTLTGSLTLHGGGDPFLSNEDLQAMAKALAASGVKQVDGAFRYDASALVDVPRINDMQPEAAGYNTGVSALSVNFNRVRLNWTKDIPDPSAAAAAISENLVLPLDAIGLAFAEQDPAGPFVRAGAPSEDRWLLSPTLAAKGEDWLPVGNPSLITADVFRALAATEGIDLPEPAPGFVPDGAREVARHESLPLSEIASAVLRYSNNLSAELIGLAASHALTGRVLSLKDFGDRHVRMVEAAAPRCRLDGVSHREPFRAVVEFARDPAPDRRHARGSRRIARRRRLPRPATSHQLEGGEGVGAGQDRNDVVRPRPRRLYRHRDRPAACLRHLLQRCRGAGGARRELRSAGRGDRSEIPDVARPGPQARAETDDRMGREVLRRKDRPT